MLPRSDLGRLDPRRDVKIRAEARVFFEPVLVVGFEPVRVSVPGGEMRGGALDLVVVFERVDAIIFGERVLQRLIQRVERRVADPEDVRAVFLQPVAELPVGMGEIGGNEDEIH